MGKAKPLAPEVLELIPNGIENLTLYCVVCRQPLPSSRRTIGDHAGACHKVRTLLRRHQIAQTKCISCLHPSTPKERDNYRKWRKAIGERNERGGRVKGKDYSKKPLDSADEIGVGGSTTSATAIS